MRSHHKVLLTSKTGTSHGLTLRSRSFFMYTNLDEELLMAKQEEKLQNGYFFQHFLFRDEIAVWDSNQSKSQDDKVCLPKFSFTYVTHIS